MPEDMRRVLFSADADFLQAAFDRSTRLGGIELSREDGRYQREQRAA